MSVTSQGMKSGRLPCRAPSSAAKAAASERWTKATRQPCSRKPSVRLAPMPEPPPVMKTLWPSRSWKVAMRGKSDPPGFARSKAASGAGGQAAIGGPRAVSADRRRASAADGRRCRARPSAGRPRRSPGRSRRAVAPLVRRTVSRSSSTSSASRRARRAASRRGRAGRGWRRATVQPRAEAALVGTQVGLGHEQPGESAPNRPSPRGMLAGTTSPSSERCISMWCSGTPMARSRSAARSALAWSA